MMSGNVPTFQDADALRTNGKYLEACEQFAQLWQQSPNPMIGWRYAFCLRKTNRLEEAERVAREALEKYPEDKYTKAELGWILYEKELRPASEQNDLRRTVEIANQILALNSEKFALTRVVLFVMRVAKERSDWKVLLEWADRLSPEDLNDQERTIEGKRGMSERETWYINRARALLELQRWDEARRFAQEGLAKFPESIFLRRTAALALARSGDLEGGIAEMRALLSHPRADWYIKAELAEMEYQAHNFQESYRLICEAMLATRQSGEYKVGYFVTLAQIALALNKIDVAAAHITLAKKIRIGKGWKIPPDLTRTEYDVLRASHQKWPDLPQDVRQLEQLCRRYWQEGKDEGLQFYRGTVQQYPEGRAFAYIKRDDGGDDVFVLIRDLPKECRQPGSRVEFALKASFDKKKQRESVQATNIRPAKG
jgi:tetratricopeptide (TPR) repeat protein